MKFCELLNQYIKILNCTGKELSELSGISPSVISRFKTGEREPAPDSDIVIALAKAIACIADKKQISQMTESIVLSNFSEALLSETIDYDRFINNFTAIYNALDLNMKSISAFTNYDTSFLYRIKSGERKVSDPVDFTNKISQYLAQQFSSSESKIKIAALIGRPVDSISTAKDYFAAIHNWLLPKADNSSSSQIAENEGDISRFLKAMDEFDLEDYIKVIHFDKINVPTLPFHLPSTKTYNGIQKMREGELDFFKLTVTSKNAKSILMCSDMPLLDLAEDQEFNKKWMFAIACSIKKGLHLNMIHYLERPFKELLLGLEAWLPIYMTGQVSPYYLPNYAAHIFHHLNYVSEVAALHGECIENFHSDGRYVLTNNKEELSFYRQKAKNLLSHAKPLMEIYNAKRNHEFQAFLNSNAAHDGNRKGILSALPIYSMSEELLNRILTSNHISASDAKKIQSYRKAEIERIQLKLSHGTIVDEIALPSADSYEEHPMLLSVAGCFYAHPIVYSYDEMIAHFKETQAFADNNANYELKIAGLSVFRNIQMEIIQDEYAIISKIKSPSIHFVIWHPHLVHALQSFSENLESLVIN